MAGDPTVVLE